MNNCFPLFGPLGKKLLRLVCFLLGHQERALAAVIVVPGEDTLSDLLLFAAILVLAVLALEVVVADELLLQANILPGRPSVSCSTHQLLLLALSTLDSNVEARK